MFSPTITLSITHKSELEEYDIKSFEDLMELSAFGTSQILKDFKIIKKYNPFEISGCKFFEFDAEYMFEHVESVKPMKVELKVFKAEHNNFYYDINCHQSSEQNQIAKSEFIAFKNSIKLV